MDGRICISDFNNNRLYIMTRDVCLVWNSIINGADFDKPGPGQKLDEKIITRNREELKLKKPCRDRLKSITAGAVFSIEFEDGF